MTDQFKERPPFYTWYGPVVDPFDALGCEAFAFGRRQIVEQTKIMNATWNCHRTHMTLDWILDGQDLAAGINALMVPR